MPIRTIRKDQISPLEHRVSQAAILATGLRGLVDRDARMIGVTIIITCLYAIVLLLYRIENKRGSQ